MDPLRPGDPRQVGRYRLLGRLGEGGMGQVFFGSSPGGRPVAVKLIRDEYAHSRQFRARFAREVEAARRVGGFHTALVVDADPDADPPWMVTAYIPGPSLYDAVTQHGPLGMQAVRTLGAGLAEGLAAIHACGLVHRDLKPGNVILAADGPRIIDFGIARTQDASEMTAIGTVLGTCAYMSPEQVSGDRAGPASDVFSLGSVLGFAAAGRNLFGGETTAAILHRIAKEPVDLLDIPVEGGLRDLFAACLAKDPAGRPPLTDILARLASPWPSGDWLPRTVRDMISFRESESADVLNPAVCVSDHRFHELTEVSAAHLMGPDRSLAVGPVRERKKVPRRAVALAGLVASVVAAVALALLLIPSDRERPSTPAKPSTPPGRIVTDDGRAFGAGGWSQFTVVVDPANTGVRLTRRLDSSVSGQSAAISVNGIHAGRWAPLAGALTIWMDQTVELPASLTNGKITLTIRNTFESSSKDFNEFTYFVDQKLDGSWRQADVVDIGPNHLAAEKAHRYRITRRTWQGTRTFSYQSEPAERSAHGTGTPTAGE
ncbi:protein kinase domain-containing protein [Actinoallomurus sp. CA-150999]|uniref:protein kinase domain-containing protein n=1 Tax=Actinoallomurus sp. CA-150999 TaxID=3239887 RepID=UPI003D8FA29D